MKRKQDKYSASTRLGNCRWSTNKLIFLLSLSELFHVFIDFQCQIKSGIYSKNISIITLRNIVSACVTASLSLPGWRGGEN